MPPSTVPTLRQQRLGAELRKLRLSAGLSSTEAAARLGIQQARMSMIEAGRYAVGADRVRALARAYSCTDRALVEALAGMTGGRTRGWWEEYRGVLPTAALDLAEAEHHATSMHIATVVHLPGLLQTPDHARALIGAAVPPLPPHEVEHRVSFRIRRQAVLYGDDPTPLTAAVHEAALRMGFGGPTVARAQLAHLVEMSERENVTVLVIPFGSGTFPSSGQSVVYLHGPVPQLDTVQLDTDHGSEFVDAHAHLAVYRAVVERMAERALDPTASRDLMHRIAREFRDP
ncbi:helix-turn-helix transcriptional regulator [Streptomyces macrosporus]|uniref:Helix-turn-helix transcriptional regulator n=1 Tax=Streptomyces macrosporus TaxID=44032 RepID=A0ABP5XGY0_9ACTN